MDATVTDSSADRTSWGSHCVMCGPRELWLSVWLSVWLSMYEAEEGMSGQQQESRLIWLRKTDDNLLTKEGNDAVLIS